MAKLPQRYSGKPTCPGRQLVDEQLIKLAEAALSPQLPLPSSS